MFFLLQSDYYKVLFMMFMEDLKTGLMEPVGTLKTYPQLVIKNLMKFKTKQTELLLL
jgi:hypothetical protein